MWKINQEDLNVLTQSINLDPLGINSTHISIGLVHLQTKLFHHL